MFAQLDTKTVYSFMTSVVDLEHYIQKASDLGYQTLGIMDCDNLYLAYHFIQACQRVNIKPVVGMEVTVKHGGGDEQLLLIALNQKGYQQLMALATAKLTGQDTWEDLAPYCQEIAVIVPYQDGKSFPNLGLPYFVGVYPNTPKLTFESPTLALHQVRYFDPQDIETLHVLHAIKDNLALKDVPLPEKHHQLLAPEHVSKLFSETYPEAVRRLEDLVSTIDYNFDATLKLPRFNRSKEAALELREVAEQGLQEKGLTSASYQERLDKELAVIHQMGFDDYFLIVWDLVHFGLKRNYYMGMGRGSAAGSLVAYALDITGIDPVRNHLLFERFLNEERYTMPDIDIDLPDIYRSEFLHYVRDRYGSDHAAQIVTFSTFGAKQAIRDVFKRFGAREHELSALTKKIGFRDTLETAYAHNMSFRQLINSRLEFQKAFEIAKRIEGKPRQTSIHAAGVVLSDRRLTNYIPLKSGDDMMVTQYDASAVEANGLLKMDFLGLRNLTFVQKMAEKLRAEQGITIAIRDIDLNDKATLALFASGNTKGIFQFEQAGAINLLKRIKPSCFEEVVATTSLNRPGASDYIDNFINRKDGKEKIDLIDPVIAPILEPTYGIMLYQEQVMQIAQIYGDFSLGKADLLRRAMSKKDAHEMGKMAADFLAGAKRLGHSTETAQHLFEMMAKFAGYGFNKSHAYAYAALAFQLAYFKAHYPDIFYDVILNYSSSSYLTDALNDGFKLVKPHINTIPYHDKITEGEILLGLRHLRQVPRELAYWLLDNRPFTGLEDFLTRLPERFQKSSLIIPLIQIGLFDESTNNRRQLENNVDSLLVFVQELGSLFADSSYHWTAYEDYSPLEKYQLEKDLLGVGISPHPLTVYFDAFKGQYVPFSHLIPDQKARLLGQIQSVKVIRTKTKGQQMAFITVTDTQDFLEVTLFPETYQRYAHLLNEQELVWLEGRVKERDGKQQLVLEELTPASLEKLWILLENHQVDAQIAAILQDHSGHIPVVLHYDDSKETLQIDSLRVAKTDALLKALKPYAMKTVFR